MSSYRAPLWDLRPDITSCRNVAFWKLRSCIYWAPSLKRGQVCNLQCNHSIVRVAQNPKSYYTVSSETPQPGRPCSRIYIPQEQGGPVIPPGTGFPLRRLLRLAGLRWRYSNPPPTWRDRYRNRNRMVQYKVKSMSKSKVKVTILFPRQRDSSKFLSS
jgi:hypothetical protein